MNSEVGVIISTRILYFFMFLHFELWTRLYFSRETTIGSVSYTKLTTLNEVLNLRKHEADFSIYKQKLFERLGTKINIRRNITSSNRLQDICLYFWR